MSKEKLAIRGGAVGLNIPNIITLCRFALIPLFLVLYLNGYSIEALATVLLSGLTDILDGYIARRSGQITVTGIMLDPLADKLMMLAIVTALLVKGEIPWQAVAVMAFREIGMIASSAFFHFRGLKTVPANVLGKATTIVYYGSIMLLLLEQPGGLALLWIGIAMSFLTTAVYFLKFRNLNRAS
ncbi:CDP-alcohol phosphatidyltransferase family protein [Cohnella caldifontis]|uniref:CDP-alcohol phosphatidyltransferase family protein n=1 Tax=Cohnella caldifontis TaxID=3027471 RepID=UPI0023EC16DD|nr:CDP-alcohol phosphatidyltransferase family protein [Cohnella sp. YIM B05605]